MDDLVGAALGFLIDALLVDHLRGLILGAAADVVRLLLGVGDEFVARVDETARLAQLHRERRLKIVEKIESLVALNDALVVAQRDAPCLRDHIIEHIDDIQRVVFHIFISSR